MTASPPSRSLLALVLVTLVVASIAGPIGAETTTVPAAQQSATQFDLQASLTGEVVVIAGWFELTATAVGRLNTSAQESDLGSTFDVDIADTFGEFEFRGEVVGTVNASRVLFSFAGNASSFDRGESAAAATMLSGTNVAAGTSSDGSLAGATTALTLDSGRLERTEPAQVTDPVEGMARQSSPAAPAAIPLQISPFRQLGLSFFDIYWQVATLVLGLVLVGVLPKTSRRVADLGASDPLRTGGAGLAVVLVAPVALLVLGLSLFGIPLAVAGTALYLVFWWVGAVYGRFTIGVWLLGAVPRALATVGVDARQIENRWAGLLVGAAVVAVLVSIPTVGPIIESLVLLLGLGGISRLAYRAFRRTERGNGPLPSRS